jgi:hypothetical protein
VILNAGIQKYFLLGACGITHFMAEEIKRKEERPITIPWVSSFTPSTLEA